MGNARVGHVLETIAHGDMFRDVPGQTDVARELKLLAKIFGAKPVAAQDGRTRTTLQGQWEFPRAQFHQRADGPDERVSVFSLQPTGRGINARLETPVGIDTPLPRQVQIRKSLHLLEPVLSARERHSATCSD